MARFIKRKNGLYMVNKSLTVILSRHEIAWVARRMGVSVDQAIALMLDLIVVRADPGSDSWVADSEGDLGLYEVLADDEVSDENVHGADYSVYRTIRR